MNTYIDPRAKPFQHMDVLHAIKHGGRPAPRNVELFLSNRCGHGCVWCHYAYTHTKGPLAGKVDKPVGALGSGDLMGTELAYRILGELKEAGVKSVTFSGGGEPTLHPHFDEVVSNAAWLGLDVGLYTHGGSITDARAAILRRAATWVYVSLDEPNAEAFRASKGVDRFEAVLSGIRRLVEAEGDATIGVGFLLHKANFHKTREMVKLGRSLGVDYVQFRPTIHYRQDAPGELAEDTAWINWAIGWLNEFRNDSFVRADIDRFERYRDWTAHGYGTCYGSALQTTISPNGMMWRCTNKTEHPSALLGDLSQESFMDVWTRAGGPCAVDGECRVMCKQHLVNLTLQPVMAEMPHSNFI